MGFIADTFHLDPDYKPVAAVASGKIRVEFRTDLKGLVIQYWRNGAAIASSTGAMWVHPDYWCVIVPKVLLATPGPVLTEMDNQRYSLADMGDEWAIPYSAEAGARRSALVNIP